MLLEDACVQRCKIEEEKPRDDNLVRGIARSMMDPKEAALRKHTFIEREGN